MADIKTPKMELVDTLRAGELSPQEAVAKFESMPTALQKNGRVYEQKNTDQRRAQYQKARKIRAEIRESRTPFITEAFLPHFWLAQGLVVVGGESGKAKSTTCSNVLHGFLEHNPYKTAIVISNEEATDAVYERTACIALKYDYTQFFQGKLRPQQEASVQAYVMDIIIPRVEVIEDGTFDMAYLEDVQSVLDSAAIARVGIVLIDYLQIITQSRENPSWESFQVSKQLGLFLKEFGKSNGVPVVCFAQLHSSTRGPTMAERVQNDKTFYNHGFACIEVVPDFETLSTTFKIHKDRFFGHTGREVVCKFDGGRYVFVGEESL
jgi:predicted ATP-dependent serine protease